MDATLDRLLGATTSNVTDTTAANTDGNNNTNGLSSFIASERFAGSKAGYAFYRGSRGIGYYIDPYQQQKASYKSVLHKRKEPEVDNKDDDDDDVDKNKNNKKRKTAEELLQEAEKEQEFRATEFGEKIVQLTKAGVINAVESFKRSLNKNILLRNKYGEHQAEQFMESELALNEDIQGLQAVAANLSLYPTLVEEANVLDPLFQCLVHANTDVIVSALKLLNELCDLDLFEETNVGEISILHVELVKNGFFQVIEEQIPRLVKDNYNNNGIEVLLTLVEHLLDADRLGYLPFDNGDTNICSILCRDTTLLSWLLGSIDNDDASSYKLHISEILASLLQNEGSFKFTSNLSTLPTFNDNKSQQDKDQVDVLDGIEVLLQAVAKYRKKDPSTEEECEWLENCFDCIAAALQHIDNNKAFLQGQGIELMLRCIREKVHSGGASLKIINYCLNGGSTTSTSGDDKNSDHHIYKRACETFVDAGGYKTLFPIFMRKSSVIPKPAACTDAGRCWSKNKNNKNNNLTKRQAIAKKEWSDALESHSLQILYSLVTRLDKSSPHDAQLRLIAKFVEDDCIKCDRLIDVILKFEEKMRRAEASSLAMAGEEEGGELTELTTFNVKLKAGGDIFHRASVIISFVMNESKRCYEHVVEQLRLKGSSILLIKSALDEFMLLLDPESFYLDFIRKLNDKL